MTSQRPSIQAEKVGDFRSITTEMWEKTSIERIAFNAVTSLRPSIKAEKVGDFRSITMELWEKMSVERVVFNAAM